jgi:hypothetical protein
VAQLNISKSVGDPLPDGTPSPNMFDDVLTVQYLLNQQAATLGLGAPLPLDGSGTPAVIAAIRLFEATLGSFDGRIDPSDVTMTALNAVALSEFEGVTDSLERRSIILRRNRAWNFTRGDFKMLTEFAGLSLTFDPSSVWLPDALKQRLLVLFNTLLNPAMDPAPTWGVNGCDWYHCHLGLWSGTPQVPISGASAAWVTSAVTMRMALDVFRTPFLVSFAIPTSNVPAYRAAYTTRMLLPDVSTLLSTYAALPEAVIVHHTFEVDAWRPQMQSNDIRRHWMVGPNGQISTPLYRTAADLDAAQNRNEFICEGTIQINFLVDKSGVIHPVLGNLLDLTTVTGIGSELHCP